MSPFLIMNLYRSFREGGGVAQQCRFHVMIREYHRWTDVSITGAQRDHIGG